MLGEYTCNYLLNSGRICERGCYRPKGCYEHWRSKERIPCKVCGKPTASEPVLCKAHAKGYYVLKCMDMKKFTPKNEQISKKA